MKGRLLAAAVGTGLCWLVALFLVLAPIQFGTSSGTVSCGRPVAAALADDVAACAERARKRVSALATWLVLTGAVSTAFVAQCALAGRRTPE